MLWVHYIFIVAGQRRTHLEGRGSCSMLFGEILIILSTQAAQTDEVLAKRGPRRGDHVTSGPGQTVALLCLLAVFARSLRLSFIQPPLAPATPQHQPTATF